MIKDIKINFQKTCKQKIKFFVKGGMKVVLIPIELSKQELFFQSKTKKPYQVEWPSKQTKGNARAGSQKS